MKKLLILLFIFGCSSSREERLLEKSKEVHETALDIGAKVKAKITRISRFSEELEEPQRTAIMDSVSILLSNWEAWESTIVEVPGHEHHHDHEHHDHSHEPSPDLTPDMVLEIQKDIHKRISNLNVRAQTILSTLKQNEE